MRDEGEPQQEQEHAHRRAERANREGHPVKLFNQNVYREGWFIVAAHSVRSGVAGAQIP